MDISPSVMDDNTTNINCVSSTLTGTLFSVVEVKVRIYIIHSCKLSESVNFRCEILLPTFLDF